VIDAYEEARRHFAGALDASMQRYGVSVLVHRGMTAWARTWARLGPPSPRPAPVSGAIAGTGAVSSRIHGAGPDLPRSLETQLVSTLAGMILPAVTGGLHVG